MDKDKEELLKNAGEKLQETAKDTAVRAEQAAVAAKTAWDGTSPEKKKKIILLSAVVLVLLCLLIFVGLKGMTLLAGLACGGWLVFCVLKKHNWKLPAILTAVLLLASLLLPGGSGVNPGNMTEKQMVEKVTKVMEKVGYELVPTNSTVNDGNYDIYAKKSMDSPAVPNGVRCHMEQENGKLSWISLVSTNGEQGLPMSALKFVAVLHAGWSSQKQSDFLNQILQTGSGAADGVTYTYAKTGGVGQINIQLN